mgnify:CR=1 FL=1
MNTNKRMTAIVLAIVIAGASLAACATHQPVNVNTDIPETTTAGEETTTAAETTAGLTVTVTNDTATEPETETLSADRTEKQETTTKSGTVTATKKSNTATTTKQTVTTTKRQTITTTKPVTTTKKPVTTTKRQTNTTTTKPVTTTKPKPTTTTTKAAPSTPTKAQIDKIVSDARAYGESLGNVWNSSLTVDNSGWRSPANTQYLSLERAKQNIFYQLKDCTKNGNFYFKIYPEKLSDGNYRIYVLRG